MKKNKGFTDILAKPGIALKLKALLTRSIHSTYERGHHYSLLPYGTEYLFAPKKEKDENETNSSGLLMKLSSSLNKIAENLSLQPSKYSYFHTKEKTNTTGFYNNKTNTAKTAYSRIEKIIGSETNYSQSFTKILFARQAATKISPLKDFSYKVNGMFRNQKPSEVSTIGSYKSNNIFSTNNTSILNRLTYPTNSALSSISSIVNKESFINLKDYITGLSALQNKKEPIVKSNFIGGNYDRSFAKPKSKQYTITQNFGDIVIQPASMEMSVQQMKYKIEDVLRKVKDSLY